MPAMPCRRGAGEIHHGPWPAFIAVSPENSLTAAVRQSVVAFQADQFTDSHDGWTVTVVGHADQVVDPADIGKLRAIGLTSWTGSGGEQYLHTRRDRPDQPRRRNRLARDRDFRPCRDG